MKGPPVKITLKHEEVPYCVTTTRRIPFPLMPKVESEIKRMDDAGIITIVTKPSDLCAPIVTAFKKIEMHACVWT